MTSITRNLPWPIRDIGVSVIGKKCYTSLIENLEFGNVECVKYSISKGLGIGIVLGGSIMKVPQILLVINARSAQGLSLTAYILETLSYAITLVYSFRNNFPFSTYGENLFLTLQNFVITALIVVYTPKDSRNPLGAIAVPALVATSALIGALPLSALQILQMLTLPLSLSSKLPQIFQNSRAQSTGQLSAVAVIAQIGGCIARLFTTATEVGDLLVSAGFAMALLLNVVLGAQMWMYWGNSAQKPPAPAKSETKAKIPAPEKQEDAKVPAYSPGMSTPPRSRTPVHRLSTPPPQSPSTGARKWARKVD